MSLTKERVLSVCFSGDVNFSGAFDGPVAAESLFAPDIVQFLADSSHNVFNIEGPITKQPFTKSNGIALRSMPTSLQVLKAMKCDVFNLANNHVMDCGERGLADTLNGARSAGIRFFGAGLDIHRAVAPVVLSGEGVTVALFGMAHQEGLLASEESVGVMSDKFEMMLRKQIEKYRGTCRWIVLSYHGGEEFSFVPTPSRRKKFRRFLDWGVDIVVAHHAHVVQPYECFEGKAIFYGLGNFVFDIQAHQDMPGSDESVLIKIKFGPESFSVGKLHTRANKDIGLIEAVSNNPQFFALKEESYRRLWYRDAKRLYGVWQRKRMRRGVSERRDMVLGEAPYRLVLALRQAMERPRRSLRVLCNKNRREVVIGAYIGRFRDWLDGKNRVLFRKI